MARPIWMISPLMPESWGRKRLAGQHIVIIGQDAEFVGNADPLQLTGSIDDVRAVHAAEKRRARLVQRAQELPRRGDSSLKIIIAVCSSITKMGRIIACLLRPIHESAAWIDVPWPGHHGDADHVSKASPCKIIDAHLRNRVDVSLDQADPGPFIGKTGDHRRSPLAAQLLQLSLVKAVDNNAVAPPVGGKMGMKFHVPSMHLRIVVDRLLNFPAILTQEKQDALRLRGSDRHDGETGSAGITRY